jgi:hypothetical protein
MSDQPVRPRRALVLVLLAARPMELPASPVIGHPMEKECSVECPMAAVELVLLAARPMELPASPVIGHPMEKPALMLSLQPKGMVPRPALPMPELESVSARPTRALALQAALPMRELALQAARPMELPASPVIGHPMEKECSVECPMAAVVRVRLAARPTWERQLAQVLLALQVFLKRKMAHPVRRRLRTALTKVWIQLPSRSRPQTGL